DTNGVEADLGNMDYNISANPTPTFRIHKDHPKSQIIGPMDTPVQTKNKSNEMEEQSFIATIHQKTTPDLLQFFLFSYFLSQEEPKKISNALKDPIYQMDVESAFLYGTIDEEVYVMQPPGFQDPEFLARVYKVEKAMYGLHQALRAWSANTPMDKENPWGKDETGKDVDLHLYRSMIGSLMYLTASRPYIMFTVCACARHQVTPKECHLHAVKRIFRYLTGHPRLGLWYPKESPFDLVAYSDSDYGGATQDRKSTTRGCQFLGRRLISQQCKKQTIVATSTTEAEYVAAANGCGQVLWIQNRLLDYGIGVFILMISLRLIPLMDGEAMINSIKNSDQPLPRVTQVSIAGNTSTEQPPLKDKSMWSDQEKRVQKIDRLARSLLIQGLLNDIYSFIDSNKTAKDLWDALARHMLSSEYGEQDRKAAILYEYETFKAIEGELFLDTYIRYLQGEFNTDFHPMVDFITASPLRYALTVKPTIYVSHIRQFWSTARIETTDEETHILAIVDGIQRTMSESSLRRNLKLRDEDGIVSISDTELFENLTLMGPKSTGFNEFSDNIATALVCLATNRTYNFSKMIFDGMVKNVNNKISKFLMYPRIETTDEGTKILATLDGKLKTISESSIRRNLKLNDKEGISTLPDAELFENLVLIGYNILPNQKFTFQKGQFSHQWKYRIHTIMQCLSLKSTGFNEFSSNIATDV
nr:uncharacterized mitochondrial protein AtMg00810-like [Tanacetum cinerariifolium]